MHALALRPRLPLGMAPLLPVFGVPPSSNHPRPCARPAPSLRPCPRRELSLGRKKAPHRLCGRFSRISMKLPRIPLRRQKLPKVVGKVGLIAEVTEGITHRWRRRLLGKGCEGVQGFG